MDSPIYYRYNLAAKDCMEISLFSNKERNVANLQQSIQVNSFVDQQCRDGFLL